MSCEGLSAMRCGALVCVVWPIAVSYWERVRLIVAWCELRQGFRHFRTDRIAAYEFLETRYTEPRARLKAQWQKQLLAQQTANQDVQLRT